MRATFKLINSYFWKTIYGPILSFVFPILLLAILGNIMKIQYVYPGILALTMLFLGVLSMPLAIMELKGSSLFKYIGSSPVNSFKFSIVLVFYYTFISIITGFLIMFSTMIIFSSKVFPHDGFSYGILGGLTTIKGFFSFYFASFFHLILVISVGLAIATFAKTPQQALTISIIVIIPSMFLSGMILSVDIIANSNTMQWISRLIPFRYSTGNLVVATTPINQLGDIFQNLSLDDKMIIFGGKKGQDILSNGDVGIKINAYSKTETDDFKRFFSSDVFNHFSNKDNNFKIKSVDDIYELFKSTSEEQYKLIFDKYLNLKNENGTQNGNFFLFYNILLSEESLNKSDNNIFLLNKAWSVRRVPDIESISKFIKSYLSDVGKEPSSAFPILKRMQEQNFEFINMFLKQNIKMYTIVERSLNLFVPMFFSLFFGFYVHKRFSWTSR